MSDLYDQKIHGAYFPPDSSRAVPERYARIVRAGRRFVESSNGRVLEVGPEVPQIPRYWIGALGLSPQRAVVADISTAAVKLLQQNGLTAIQADLSTDGLPFEHGTFDLVILSEVVEHLTNSDRALVEIHRLLRPGGGLVVTTPNLGGWVNRIQLLLGLQPIGTETGTEWVFGRGPWVPRARPVGHLQLLTLRALRELLQYHSFDLVELEGLPFSADIPGVDRVRRMDRWLCRFPSLASSLMAVAQRRADDA